MRHFLAILALTALVWTGVVMSEYHEYPFQLEVDMSGFDANRYAVLSADTALVLNVEQPGFDALWLSLRKGPQLLSVDVRDVAVHRFVRQRQGVKELCFSIAVSDLGERFHERFDRYGARRFSSSRDSVRLVLVERAHKTLRPSIANVSLSFADGCGLYGEPVVSPREVTLYGPEEALSQINELHVKPIRIHGIDGSHGYRLALDPVWNEFGDVHVSTEYLTLKLPVESFVERDYTLPVSVEGIDGNVNLRLYPDRVTARVWVAQKDITEVSAAQFSLVADYRDVLKGSRRLKLRMARFPEGVRLRSLSSDEVQYVIIR